MINRYKTLSQRRKIRVRSKIFGTSLRPRLTVFRSNAKIYAQIIDDQKGCTLIQANSLKLSVKKGQTKTDIAKAVGESIAKQALSQKITTVVFDRGHYQYHGRVKALAEAARAGGLKF